jgi:hypothetical protein
MMLRPMTLRMKGLTVSSAGAGPAMAKISFPAAATGLAPKTGEAINVAPFSARRSAAEADVSGWIVEVSINILRLKEMLLPSVFDSSSLRTSSFEICGSQHLVNAM